MRLNSIPHYDELTQHLPQQLNAAQQHAPKHANIPVMHIWNEMKIGLVFYQYIRSLFWN